MRVEEMREDGDGGLTVVLSATMEEITALASEAMLAKIADAAIAGIADDEASERIRRLKSSLTEAKLEYARMVTCNQRLRAALRRAAAHMAGAMMPSQAHEAIAAAEEVI